MHTQAAPCGFELRVGRVNTAFNLIVSAHCAQQAYPFAPLPEQVCFQSDETNTRPKGAIATLHKEL